jgi:hypothetical protein
MKLTFLTNHVAPYRVSTLAALSHCVEEMSLLLTSRDIVPGLEKEPIRIKQVPCIHIHRSRKHPTGYVEGYEVHVPIGTLPALLRQAAPNVFAVELGLRTAFSVLWRYLGPDRRVVVHADLSEATEQGRGEVRRLFRRALLRHVDLVLVNGASGMRYVRSLGVPDSKIGLLPYASDLERFAQIADLRAVAPPGAPLRLLYVGRLAEVKGLEPFVRRLALVLQARPGRSVEFTLVGDGDQRTALEAVSLPPNLKLIFEGPVTYDEVAPHYARCDVGVLPSLGDTWGLGVNEAMSAGRPVLGSVAAQAADELIEESVNGWRFDARYPSSIDDAILRMIDAPRTELARMGRHARITASQLSAHRVAQMIVDAFRRTRGLPPIAEAAGVSAAMERPPARRVSHVGF